MGAQLTMAELLLAHEQEFISEYGAQITPEQRRALWFLPRCQTPKLGGHLSACKDCGHQEYRNNSCRYRGCPQCEGSKEAAWLLEREEELLPVHYFHIVFTVPHVLNELFLRNQRECYAALFEAAAKTLMTVGKKRLHGAKLGFFGILHTWGRLLQLHPHVHFVVPGGGISPDAESWISTSKRRRYFAPKKVLAEVFRGILVKKLKRRYRDGKLIFEGDFEELMNLAVKRRWVVHPQPPFGSPLHVLKYLSRYTRKVALSNSRLLELKDGKVTFSFKDYTDNSKRKLCRMRATELIRRFLLHVLPSGFVRIRYYGFMAGAGRRERLREIRKTILGLLPQPPPRITADRSFQPNRCPSCGNLAMKVIQTLFKNQPSILDSS